MKATKCLKKTMKLSGNVTIAAMYTRVSQRQIDALLVIIRLTILKFFVRHIKKKQITYPVMAFKSLG